MCSVSRCVVYTFIRQVWLAFFRGLEDSDVDKVPLLRRKDQR